MLKNPIFKNILSALDITGFGYILLNLTFLFDFLFQSLLDRTVRLFGTSDINVAWPWYPPTKHAMFLVIIALISWAVFCSKLGVLYKAIFMTVPAAVGFVTIGILFYRWPWAAYSISALLGFGVLFCFYRRKYPWQYFYAIILIGATLAVFSLLGGEI